MDFQVGKYLLVPRSQGLNHVLITTTGCQDQAPTDLVEVDGVTDLVDNLKALQAPIRAPGSLRTMSKAPNSSSS
jgi:hypothetical protein